jgi:uncharacterized protein YqjF (DUF2071 family)
MPPVPWILRQTWTDLLFLHWPVAPARLRDHVPAALELDLFGDDAWLSLTAFEVRGTRLRGTPAPPRISRFLELNVRTYVTVGDRPGVFFFSLDAACRAAVVAARLVYRLPYLHARMAMARRDGWIEYVSARDDRRAAPADFSARYRASGAPQRPAPGSLEHWLLERYRLYTVGPRGSVLFAGIRHRPWSLAAADVEIRANTMAAPLGMEPGPRPSAHVASDQDVVFWLPRRVAAR